MFSEQERQELADAIRSLASQDAKLLEGLRDDLVKYNLARSVTNIRPVRATTTAIVATDGGNHAIRFDPFHHQVIRVVDSDGKTLGLQAISTTTDLRELFEADRIATDARGRPKPVARLISDIERAVGKRFRSYRELCPSIWINPDKPEHSTGWVTSYRDLWEWAVVYDYIVSATFSQSTMVVRDGLLRSKLFAENYFAVLGDLLAERIQQVRHEDKKRVFLVGVAKGSSVLDLYRLALEMEQVLPPGQPRYVRVPREMESRAYKFPEFGWGRERLKRHANGLCAVRESDGVMRGREVLPSAPDQTEDSKFVFGTMFLARFTAMEADPIWLVDMFDDQVSDAAEVMGYLYNDALDGFPVPAYPGSLQRAHEQAMVTEFDAEILNSAVMDAVRAVVNKDREGIVERLTLMGDLAGRRY